MNTPRKKTRYVIPLILSALMVLSLIPSSGSYAISKASKKELTAFEYSLAKVNNFSRKLIKERGAVSPEQKLWVISDYICDPANGFVYGRSSKSRLGADFFEARSGVCSDFSILFALMARAVGIKADYMNSEKREHAIVSFIMDNKRWYYDITNSNAYSPDKSFVCKFDDWDRYISGDQYKAAFLNKTGALYELDHADNRGYTDKVTGYIISTDPTMIKGIKSDDYKVAEAFDFGNIESIKSYTRPVIKSAPKSGGIKLLIRKPKNFSNYIRSYEIRYKTVSGSKWTVPRTYKYSANKRLTIKGLKKRKSYYIQVRAVKVIGGVRYECNWVKVKCKVG